ncbi:MAG: MlaC/ttg2D family ABC transporter substrate-binding protein [Alphaproteobacteria bacterium]
MTATFSHADTKSEEKFFENIRLEVLTVLTDKGMNANKKEKIISVKISDSIASLQIGRSVLGQPWRSLKKKQKKEYIQVFGIWVGKVIARRLISFDIKQDLKVTKVYKGNQGIVIIRSVAINPKNNQKVTIDWYIRKIKGKSKLLDVSVANISMISTQRSEFAALYSRKGIDGLIQQMKSQY